MTLVPKIYNKVFLLTAEQLWGLNWILIGLCIQTFQTLNVIIYRRGKFVSSLGMYINLNVFVLSLWITELIKSYKWKNKKGRFYTFFMICLKKVIFWIPSLFLRHQGVIHAKRTFQRIYFKIVKDFIILGIIWFLFILSVFMSILKMKLLVDLIY